MEKSEALSKLLNQWVLVLEVNAIQRKKKEAVAAQKFKEACEFREEEVKLSKDLLSLEEIREIKNQI